MLWVARYCKDLKNSPNSWVKIVNLFLIELNFTSPITLRNKYTCSDNTCSDNTLS